MLASAALACTPEPQLPELPPIPEIALDELSGSAARQVAAAQAELQAAPEDAERNGALAMLLDAYDRAAAAETLYARAHALDPGALRWSYLLGTARLARGELDGAAAALRRALEIAPDYEPARTALADALYQANDFAESRQLYEQALAANVDDPRALLGLARLLSAVDDFGAASQKLERAVAVAPGYGAAHYELALAYRDLGRDADSRREMAIYEQTRNGLPPADLLRAQVEALRVDATSRIARAAELARRGDLDGAIREHVTALEESPEMAQAHINLVSLYGRRRDFAKAREHADKALELAPERAELHYNLGVLEVTERRLAAAETAFRKAVELNPGYAAALTNLGQMLETKNRYKEATQLYRRAVESRPDYALGRFHLGRMLLGQNQPAKAVEQFRAALEPEGPQTAEVWMGLFAAQAQLGKLDEAKRAAARARALGVQYGRDDLVQAIDHELARLP